MKRIESGIIAIMKDRTIIWFEEDKEYREWIKTEEKRRASFLFSDPKQIVMHLIRESRIDTILEEIQDAIENYEPCVEDE